MSIFNIFKKKNVSKNDTDNILYDEKTLKSINKIEQIIEQAHTDYINRCKEEHEPIKCFFILHKDTYDITKEDILNFSIIKKINIKDYRVIFKKVKRLEPVLIVEPIHIRRYRFKYLIS